MASADVTQKQSRYIHAKQYPIGTDTYVVIGNEPGNGFDVYFEIVNHVGQRCARCTHTEALSLLTLNIIDGAIDFLYNHSDNPNAVVDLGTLIVPKLSYSSYNTSWQLFFLDKQRQTEVCIDDEMWRRLKKLRLVLCAQIKYNVSLRDTFFHYDDVLKAIAREMKETNIKFAYYDRKSIITNLYLNKVDKLDYREQVMLLELLSFHKNTLLWDFRMCFEAVCNEDD
ncbi:uncharacterized protein LOC113215717 [Frankliniella occidentalis]|uniref:Uncharacterized protein LOC113215717 n=1 Tax=Frankliniella occidentalis TaxID=133901 RepID=A0A6J1TC74_FRAOC|nr:uncharacterized protein LOC113215717 [Frankliniella occidentalis]XP_026291165.2 uncharacterized protein LOC113215717 [Frankliniella occidentalis]